MPTSRGYKVFTVFNIILLSALALICLLPLLNVLAISLSDRAAVAAGQVALWPVDFTLASYEYVLEDKAFFSSLWVSVFRVVLGGALNVLLCILCAYPLSKPRARFRMQPVYVWIFLFASLFNGGLIPTYMVVKGTGLIDSILALVIPGAVPVFYMIMMVNFFRRLPKELEEAALVDGAGHFTILWRIYVPLSMASIATITLFSVVNHWNSWFDGMIYMNKTDLQPMATFLHNKVVASGLEVMKNTQDLATLERLLKISNQTTKSAQIFLAMVPILCVYPFLRKYFATGVVMGSVKG
jgi:putative aldouronate transport system permease protein